MAGFDISKVKKDFFFSGGGLVGIRPLIEGFHQRIYARIDVAVIDSWSKKKHVLLWRHSRSKNYITAIIFCSVTHSLPQPTFHTCPGLSMFCSPDCLSPTVSLRLGNVLQQLLFSMATALQVAVIRSFLISLTDGVQNVLFLGHLLSGRSSTQPSGNGSQALAVSLVSSSWQGCVLLLFSAIPSAHHSWPLSHSTSCFELIESAQAPSASCLVCITNPWSI